MRSPASTASRSAALDDLGDAVVVLGDRAVERRDHGERLAEGALGLDGDVDVDRADLEADTAALEQREPCLREHPVSPSRRSR